MTAHAVAAVRVGPVKVEAKQTRMQEVLVHVCVRIADGHAISSAIERLRKGIEVPFGGEVKQGQDMRCCDADLLCLRDGGVPVSEFEESGLVLPLVMVGPNHRHDVEPKVHLSVEHREDVFTNRRDVVNATGDQERNTLTKPGHGFRIRGRPVPINQRSIVVKAQTEQSVGSRVAALFGIPVRRQHERRHGPRAVSAEQPAGGEPVLGPSHGAVTGIHLSQPVQQDSNALRIPRYTVGHRHGMTAFHKRRGEEVVRGSVFTIVREKQNGRERAVPRHGGVFTILHRGVMQAKGHPRWPVQRKVRPTDRKVRPLVGRRVVDLRRRERRRCGKQHHKRSQQHGTPRALHRAMLKPARFGPWPIRHHVHPHPAVLPRPGGPQPSEARRAGRGRRRAPNTGTTPQGVALRASIARRSRRTPTVRHREAHHRPGTPDTTRRVRQGGLRRRPRQRRRPHHGSRRRLQEDRKGPAAPGREGRDRRLPPMPVRWTGQHRHPPEGPQRRRCRRTRPAIEPHGRPHAHPSTWPRLGHPAREAC